MIFIELQQALILIGLILLGFGVFYAAVIYYRPFAPGWTWVSVLIGDAVTDACVGAALLVAVSSLGRAELWWVALFPLAGHVLSGGPMIAGQVIKWAAQKRRNSHLDRELQ
jgi:hypothetical protein